MSAEAVEQKLTRNEARKRVTKALIEAGIAEDIQEKRGTLTDNAQVVLARRYLVKDQEGAVAEDADSMFRRVAENLSMADLRYGATEEEREKTRSKFYKAMKQLQVLPNSPTLMNAGRELQQLSACFVLPVEDSLEEIFEGVKHTALIHKSGGGTGFSFSRLRQEGATVGSTGGVASGPVSFIRAYDTATDVVKQGGTRRGANMGILHVTHPDILKFIHAKDTGQELQNFNVSVAVSDEFMEKVANGDDYELIDPRNGRAVDTLNARQLFDELVESAWKTGDPGLIFLDAINRENPNPQLGMIESTNPCFAGDMRLATTGGLKTFQELHREQNPLTVLTDNRATAGRVTGAGEDRTQQGRTATATRTEAGTTLREAKPVFMTRRNWPVFRLTTERGYEVTATGDHRFFTEDGPKELQKLERGDRILLQPGKGVWNAAGTLSTREAAALGADTLARAEDPDTAVPDEIWTADIKAVEAFLSEALHGQRLNTASPRLAREMQLLLLNNGVLSTRRDTGDGRHSLTAGEPSQNTNMDRVAGVEFHSNEDVYCTTEPLTHSIIANGFTTAQCGEQPLLPYESCNLASINLARMVRFVDEDTEIDWDILQETVQTTVHMLDNVIDMNRYPIPEIEEMTKRTRRIGLGIMGFADLLVQMGIPYDSEEALQLAGSILGTIQSECHRASIELALERGTFPAWEGSIYNKNGNPGERRMRNSAPTTIAPTGTISIIAGVSSGIEPLFALVYVRNVMDNTKLVEGNPYFEAVARAEGFYSDTLLEEIERHGSLENTSVPRWVKDLFRTSHDISPEWHVRMQGRAQSHVDNAVSKTINFRHNATMSDVSQAYRLAYELGCKGITVYRDGSKEGQVLSTGETTGQNEQPGSTNGATRPRSRPQSMSGKTERIRTGHGNMYITINFDEASQPFEVFGNQGKAGGCDSAQLEAITRLASLALRSGIDPAAVVEQLDGITCCPNWDSGTLVKSNPHAVALALDRHINGDRTPARTEHFEDIQMSLHTGRDNGSPTATLRATPQCPECGSPTVVEEGCVNCKACAWNKCE